MPSTRVIRCSVKAYQVVAKVAGVTGLSLADAMELVVQERVLANGPTPASFEEWLQVLEVKSGCSVAADPESAEAESPEHKLMVRLVDAFSPREPKNC